MIYNNHMFLKMSTGEKGFNIKTSQIAITKLQVLNVGREFEGNFENNSCKLDYLEEVLKNFNICYWKC